MPISMTHLAYVVPAYLLAVLVPGGFALSAWLRLRAAKRRLRALEARR